MVVAAILGRDRRRIVVQTQRRSGNSRWGRAMGRKWCCSVVGLRIGSPNGILLHHRRGGLAPPRGGCRPGDSCDDKRCHRCHPSGTEKCDRLLLYRCCTSSAHQPVLLMSFEKEEEEDCNNGADEDSVVPIFELLFLFFTHHHFYTSCDVTPFLFQEKCVRPSDQKRNGCVQVRRGLYPRSPVI